MKAFLLAAGVGSRLRPITDATPNCMVVIGGQPLLDIWLDAFHRAGVDEVLVNLHHLPDQVLEISAPVPVDGDVETVFERCAAEVSAAIRRSPAIWGFWPETGDLVAMGLIPPPRERFLNQPGNSHMMDQQIAPRSGADLFLLHARGVDDFRERDDMLFAYLSDSDSVNVTSVDEMYPIRCSPIRSVVPPATSAGADVMMRGLAGHRHRQVTRMNVPVHQVMFTPDRDALPPPAAEEIRSRAGGDPYRMWFLDDARALIGDVYGPEVLDAFDSLRPLAYKADLARYCIVNHIGGIYIDLSVTAFLGFDVSDYEFVGFRCSNSAETSWRVSNGMFYSTKDSPILQASISECVANVRRRFYGKDPLFPTGPSVLGRAVADRSLEAKVQIGDYWWLKRRRNKYTLPGQGVIARGKVGGRYLGGVSGILGGNDYNVMWQERTIYGSDGLMHRSIGF